MSGRWIVVCACLAVAGCNSEPRLEAPAAKALRGDVADARAAAREGDRAAALSALDRVHDGIEAAEAGGQLDEREAANLRQGVRRAKRRVEQELAEPTPVPTAEPTATAEPAPTAEPEKPKEEKPGKGHGGGNDEEGDD